MDDGANGWVVLRVRPLGTGVMHAATERELRDEVARLQDALDAAERARAPTYADMATLATVLERERRLIDALDAAERRAEDLSEALDAAERRAEAAERDRDRAIKLVMDTQQRLDAAEGKMDRMREQLAALTAAIEAYHAKFQIVATCTDGDVDGHIHEQMALHAVMLKLAREA